MAKTPSVSEAGALPTLASVIFIRITEFSRRPVAEQARLRAQLEAALAIALIDIDPESRIVLDAPDGMAIAVLRDPAAALRIGQRCMHVAGAGVSVAAAINHGAVRLAPDAAGHPGLIGDAIGTASAIAHFAGPARMFVSRAFRDALAEAAPARAAQLRPAGVFTDANVRTHELLAFDERAAPARRRLLIAFGAFAIAGIGAAAYSFRDEARLRLFADQPAAIRFDVHPDGEIVVNGQLRGRTPPLGALQVLPGVHQVEIRKRGFPSHELELLVGPGQTVTVRHSFEAAAPQRPLLRRLRNFFGREH